MKTSNVYSAFKNEYYNEIKGVWVEEIRLFQFNFMKSSIELKTDWRFKEVKNKRSQARFIGLYGGTFPVEDIESHFLFTPIFFSKPENF